MNYFERCGRTFDVAVSVLTGGPENVTLSVRSALARGRGELWGCIFCKLLDVLVQWHHCDLVLTDAPTPGPVYVRSALAFAVLGIVLFALWHGAAYLVRHL